VWAAEASDISLLHALFYTRSNADLDTLLAVGIGAQQDRVTGGSVLVAETMAAGLGDRVVLGCPVRRIEHDGSGVRVMARDGSQYRGDAALVIGPVKVTFDNSPPSGTPGVLMGFLEGNEARMARTGRTPLLGA
jgi:monoamine oxidase